MKIPSYVSQQYKGGAREFKAKRRAALRDLKTALSELRRGCAYFPCGVDPVHHIADQVVIIEKAICVKKWGR